MGARPLVAAALELEVAAAVLLPPDTTAVPLAAGSSGVAVPLALAAASGGTEDAAADGEAVGEAAGASPSK